MSQGIPEDLEVHRPSQTNEKALIEEELEGTAGHLRRKLEHILRDCQFPGVSTFARVSEDRRRIRQASKKDGA